MKLLNLTSSQNCLCLRGCWRGRLITDAVVFFIVPCIASRAVSYDAVTVACAHDELLAVAWVRDNLWQFSSALFSWLWCNSLRSCWLLEMESGFENISQNNGKQSYNEADQSGHSKSDQTSLHIYDKLIRENIQTVENLTNATPFISNAKVLPDETFDNFGFGKS